MENPSPLSQAHQDPAETSIPAQQNQPIQAAKPVQKKMTSSPNKLFIALAIVGFALIGGGGYVLGRNAAKGPGPVQPSTPVQLPTSSAATFTQTYVDKETGISFEYPKTWIAQKMSGWTLQLFLDDHPFQIPQATEFKTPIQVHFNEVMDTVTNKKKFAQGTIEEAAVFYKKNYYDEEVQQTSLMIDGHKAIQLDGKAGPGMLQGTKSTHTLIQMDGKVLVISLDEDKDFKQVYEQILSTFKFTSAKSADNLLKYKNSTYGFTVEYPTMGEGPTGTTIACGKNIIEDQGSLVLHTDFENYFGIFSVKGYQTVKKYLDEEQLSVSLAPLTIRGADEAYKVSDANGTSLQYIMRKGTSIVRIDKNNGVLEGCFQPKDWDITKNFYFE